jgi:hypothetical protein
MGTDRAEEHSLAAEEPGEQTVGSALPAIAAKADDLEEIKKSVEDAASVSGGLWLSCSSLSPTSRSRQAPSPMKIFCWNVP